MKNRLEALRKQRSIKQEDLAAALEVSRQTIGSLENGRYNLFRRCRLWQDALREMGTGYEQQGRMAAHGVPGVLCGALRVFQGLG